MADRSTGVFAISVAAEMLSMQVQNLRVYERHGLVDPDRTPGGTRLYSHEDLDQLARVRDLLGEGLNLVGIGRVLALEAEVGRLRHANKRLRDARQDTVAAAWMGRTRVSGRPRSRSRRESPDDEGH